MRIRDFQLERFFARHEFSVKYLACASDPESMTVRELLALEPAAAEGLASLGLGYTETTGHPALREQIARLYGEQTTAEQVLVFTGAEEPIFAFMNVAVTAGDHVIVHAPAYQSLYEVARAAGAEVTLWQAREADGWQLDPDELKSLLTPNTRAIVINSPHNPTGALLQRSRLEAIAQIAERHGAWLFSDEAYRGLEHDPAMRNPAACDLTTRGVSLGAMAKTYGLAGLRIGWVACHDAELLQRLAAFKDYLTICAPGPSEFLATVALKHADTLAARARELVLQNKAIFEALEAPWSCVSPTAGTTAFPRLHEGLSSSTFSDQVLADTGVLLMPSHQLDAGDRHLRLGLGRKSFREAMQVFDTWLARHTSKMNNRAPE